MIRLIVRYNKLPSVCYYTHLPFPHYLQIETNSFNHIAQSSVKNYSATTLLLFIAELLLNFTANGRTIRYSYQRSVSKRFLKNSRETNLAAILNHRKRRVRTTKRNSAAIRRVTWRLHKEKQREKQTSRKESHAWWVFYIYLCILVSRHKLIYPWLRFRVSRIGMEIFFSHILSTCFSCKELRFFEKLTFSLHSLI